MSRRVLAAGIALLLAVNGCTTSRRIATRDEFAQLQPDRPITVYARGDRRYLLSEYALRDSVLHGAGTLSQGHETSRFHGDIPFTEILTIRTDSRSVLKGLAIVGVTAMFIGYLADGIGSETGLAPTVGTTRVSPGSSGTGTGTSCPYVYAWDGAQYRLQAEPFGVAWGKALELTTLHLLPAARVEDGVVRLRLTNEREETHYVNSIGLRRIDLGTAPAAVLDGDGRAWPLSHPAAPVAGRDRSGQDILPQVAAADARLWECAPSSLTAGSGYQDVLTIVFTRPRHAVAGSLVLTGINTEFSTALYQHLCQVVGVGQAAVLAHAVETDPELIAELRDYLRDASLKADVWNGHDWEPAGAFLPEANAVAFTRALRIRIPDGAGDSVRVRLQSMADVWKIDAISADWGDASPLPMTPVALQSAVGPLCEDLRGAIGADDEHYAILLPPDRVDLTFALPPETGARVAYAVAGRGYLIEWEPRSVDDGSTALAAFVPQEQRIAFLKEAMRHRELVLEPVYEQWRELRAR